MIGRIKAFVGLVLFTAPIQVQGISRTSEWFQAERNAENAVVQIVAHHAHFNWLEPYKAPKQKEGCGTGFLIDALGHLLTNFHVVEGAKSLKVFMPALGQKSVDARIVGVCPQADVALLKISDDGLAAIKSLLKRVPFLKFGDADSLYPTEPVLALGYPLGKNVLKSTVGVVAGLRELMCDKFVMHITAPINPGNSGGPLLNLAGHVVGINSAGIPGAQSIGYSIPINDVAILMKDLKSMKLVRKPYLGICCNETTEEHARALGNPLPAGAYINAVENGSLAQKAGIEPGDMLYSINGYPVDSYGDVTVKWPGSFKVSFREYLVRLPSKAKLRLQIYRKGKEKIVATSNEVTQPQPNRYVHADYEPTEVDYEVMGGACFMQLRQNHLDFFERVPHLQKYRQSSDQSKQALLITKLLPGSIFHRSGCLHEGVLLSEINGKKVETLSQLREALKESSSTGVISLTTKDKIATVVSLDELVKDEKRITKDFMFSTTPGMKSLITSRKKVLDRSIVDLSH
ncbi:trypsin-like peptidase domain-containing protein [Candidatus Dependentiae bacterium]|nr:trypsin-like peptidase domain-containing protein [Candidatus Dependentiae bacterium]